MRLVVFFLFFFFYSVNADRLAVQPKGNPNSTQANMKGTLAKHNKTKQNKTKKKITMHNDE